MKPKGFRIMLEGAFRIYELPLICAPWDSMRSEVVHDRTGRGKARGVPLRFRRGRKKRAAPGAGLIGTSMPIRFGGWAT
jgi:hypothetical protein